MATPVLVDSVLNMWSNGDGRFYKLSYKDILFSCCEIVWFIMLKTALLWGAHGAFHGVSSLKVVFCAEAGAC